MKHLSLIKAALGAAAATFVLTASVHAGDVTGKVAFNGDAPSRKVVKMDADPKCAAIHGDKKVGTEDVLVSKAGEVANVFVYLKDVKGEFPVPTEPALIDQVGCMYTPHVQGIRTGQKLLIRNSDDTMHNIHFLGKANPEFNFGQPTKGDRDKDFRKAEVGAKFKCDVHPWMSAFVHIMDHPFFAVSGKDGAYTIKGVPAGEYTIVAWHEKFGETEQKITVGADGAATADFSFSGAGK
jgi:hypothetical protein